MATIRLPKDVHYLCRHVDAHSNGQAKVTEVDDNLQFLMLEVTPTDGYYRGARLRFRLQLNPDTYPNEAPLVVCLDKVYHPNIDPTEDLDMECLEGSNVCVSLLDEWDCSMGLDHIVMAILFLLYNPNPEDALSPYFDGSALEDDDFETNVRLSLKGGTVDGTEFPCLLLGDNDDSENNDKDLAPLKVNNESNDTNSANAIEILMPVDGSDGTKNSDRVGIFMSSKPLSAINRSASGSNFCAELDANHMTDVNNKYRLCVSMYNNVFLCNPQVGALFSTFFTNFRLAADSLRTNTNCTDEDGELD